MTEEASNPLDLALDLLVYVPVGLAITAAEELPRLAEKGRNRIGNQISMARVVGQFAVGRGRQTIEKRLAGPAPARSWPPSGARVEAPGPYDDLTNASGPVVPSAPAPAAGPEDPASTRSAPAPSGPSPDPDALAIPGYDSLSASQVVQRLAGLSGEELSAVRTYEGSHRGRRTILNRIDQLQGQ